MTQDGEGRDKLAKRAFSGRVRSYESFSGALGIGLCKILGTVWFWKLRLYPSGCDPEKHNLKIVTGPLLQLSDPLRQSAVLAICERMSLGKGVLSFPGVPKGSVSPSTGELICRRLT